MDVACQREVEPAQRVLLAEHRVEVFVVGVAPEVVEIEGGVTAEEFPLLVLIGLRQGGGRADQNERRERQEPSHLKPSHQKSPLSCVRAFSSRCTARTIWGRPEAA